MSYEPTAAQIEEFFDAVFRDDTIAVRAMLSDGFPPNTPSSHGTSMLYRPVFNGHYATAQALLDAGADPNINGIDKRVLSQGETPLHNACSGGHLALAWLLLDKGADPSIEGESRENAVHALVRRGGQHEIGAAWYGSATKLLGKMLDAGLSPQAKDKHGLPLLCGVIASGFPLEAVEILLDCGADPRWRSPLDSDPLHLAALHDRADVVSALILRGIDINCPDGGGRTVMHHAKNSGTAEALRALGASIDVQDKQGNTPLHMLIERSDLPFPADTDRVLQLLAAGARVDLRNRDGQTVFDIAKAKDRVDILPLIAAANARLAMERVAHGAAVSRNGRTPS